MKGLENKSDETLQGSIPCVYLHWKCGSGTTKIDRGSSVKVKHSFVRELSNVYEFEYM